MSRTKEDLITYRIQRAYDTLDSAKTLARSEHWNGVANRLYYACFYAVLALLARKRHGYLHAQRRLKLCLATILLNQELIDAVWGKLYQKLFDNRNEADYEDFIDFDEEKIGAFMEDAEQFIVVITSLAKQEN